MGATPEKNKSLSLDGRAGARVFKKCALSPLSFLPEEGCSFPLIYEEITLGSDSAT